MKLRLVKFLTSRENEIEEKEEESGALPLRALSSLSQAAARAPASAPTSVFFSSHHFRFPLPPPSPTSPQPTRPACQPPRVGRAMLPAIPSPAVPLLPSFFIKLPKQQSGEGRTVAGAYLTGPAVLFNDNTARAQLARHPCSFIQSSGRPPAPVSRCGPSTAGEAIGKQSMKINYPVSSPSLMDKRTEGSRTRGRRLLCYIAVLVSTNSLPRRAVLYHLLPLRGYEQFPFFTNSSNFWEQRQLVEGCAIFISSFHFFADLAKPPVGQPLCPPPTQLVVPARRPTSGS